MCLGRLSVPPLCTLPQCRNSGIQLRISSIELRRGIEWDFDIGSETYAFQHFALPRPVCRYRQSDAIAPTDFKCVCSYETAGCLGADNRCQAVFSGERTDHFTCASGMFVHEDRDFPVEPL